MSIVGQRRKLSARLTAVVMASAILIPSVVGAVMTSATSAGAAPVAAASRGHALTPNPTVGSAGGLHASVTAWSNGLTVQYSGDTPGLNTQLIYYGSGSSTQKVLDAVTCNGSDYSVFISLSAGEWSGNVTLITALTGSIPGFDFDLEVGTKGSKPAPPVSCQSPTPFSGSVDQPVVGGAATPDGKGYWMVGFDGSVQAFGDALWYGDMSGDQLNAPIVGMAATPDGGGYWLIAQDGGVFSFGDAQFYGSTGALHLNQPVVGMAATPDGKGYWFVAADGGVFSYGDARFYGSTGHMQLNLPVVGMAPTPSGHGYYLVALDGGIFAFGDAQFRGSEGGTPLNEPVVGMSIDPKTGGYWEVAADGGIFSFGAPFFGSTGNLQLAAPVVGMTSTATGAGYRLIAGDGGVFDYGDAQFYGSGSTGFEGILGTGYQILTSTIGIG